jgi:hypothetical protein
MPALVHGGAVTLHDVRTSLLPQASGTLVQIGGATTQAQDTLLLLRTQMLPEARQTVMRVDELAGSLTDTADRIRRNPAVLVRGTATPAGPGEGP